MEDRTSLSQGIKRLDIILYLAFLYLRSMKMAYNYLPLLSPQHSPCEVSGAEMVLRELGLAQGGFLQRIEGITTGFSRLEFEALNHYTMLISLPLCPVLHFLTCTSSVQRVIHFRVAGFNVWFHLTFWKLELSSCI